MALFQELQGQQERDLAKKPSEPYGWARLAYLRYQTSNDERAAFAALRMSDFTSPYEAPQLPERAYMWMRFRNVESADQKAYQDVLWQKAFSMERDATWRTARQNNIDNEVGQSLKRTDPALYAEWQEREASKLQH
ncbi:MAG: hypothetical protein M3N08_05145 [Pseudomonadota bacterium]|nr:hypothetical protein [Pseudomonadota bacterium]